MCQELHLTLTTTQPRGKLMMSTAFEKELMRLFPSVHLVDDILIQPTDFHTVYVQKQVVSL